MKSFKQIANAMYAAYYKVIDRHELGEEVIRPPIEKLQEHEIAAWFNAAQAAHKEITEVHSATLIEGYTGNLQADAALVMLDRLDVWGDDDTRVDAISKIIRELAATKPQQEPVAKIVISNDQFIGWNPKLSASDIQKLDGQSLYTSPPARKPMSDDELASLRDAFAQALTSVYVCGRVWSAWNYGTMSEDDFQPASECEEVMNSLIEAAHGIGAKA